ncbi:uncharacterized protein LOC113147145 [Cyclospora cayetanensis]|uniref:Uncharacterized protein LOC113147145 n=1 Tax=Cyclospora cayetanensis TaxID=88456 RepID=A0A6P6RX21_9EIME|nr:uncharacterized protein LOC113147145 [Cyclospora cayetanensis]
MDLQNYDDQSVDSVPSSTGDFQYTTAYKATPFFPDSEVHAVEVQPLQERFTGMHTAENELFRVEMPVSGEKLVGDRVVSGLAVDEAGRQYQAHGPAPSLMPVPGLTPLCETYNNPAMSLEVARPMSLLLKGHECNVAKVTAFVRLGSASAAGIIFRANSQEDYVSAVLDTDKRVASLQLKKGGVETTLTEAPILYINPSIRHEITVNDRGEHGPLEMFVDNRVVISYEMPHKGRKDSTQLSLSLRLVLALTDRGRFGIEVRRGSALFDGFAIER